MDVKTAIESRRAVRKLDPSHHLGEAEIQELMSLTMLSPTAFNIQHWRFVLVQDPATRERIRAACWMQPQITDASLLVVICADVQAWQKSPERYWHTAPEDVRKGLLEGIRAHYEGRDQFQVEEAMRSCGIAAQTLMLAAQSMGLHTSPMDLGDPAAVAEIINLPKDHVIAMYVAIGKAIGEPWPRGGQLPYNDVVKIDSF